MWFVLLLAQSVCLPLLTSKSNVVPTQIINHNEHNVWP